MQCKLEIYPTVYWQAASPAVIVSLRQVVGDIWLLCNCQAHSGRRTARRVPDLSAATGQLPHLSLSPHRCLPGGCPVYTQTTCSLQSVHRGAKKMASGTSRGSQVPTPNASPAIWSKVQGGASPASALCDWHQRPRSLEQITESEGCMYATITSARTTCSLRHCRRLLCLLARRPYVLPICTRLGRDNTRMCWLPADSNIDAAPGGT